MACCRAAWRRAAAGQTVSPAGLEGVGVGGLQLRSPPLRPSPLPYPWPQTASQVPTSPLHPLPPVGGHSWSRRFGAGGCAHQLPAPSPNPAVLHLQPSRTPFFPGQASLPTAPMAEGNISPLLPSQPHSLASPGVPRGARAPASPKPTPQCTFCSLPGHGSPCPVLGQRERAVRWCRAPRSWALGSQCANCTA